MLVGNNATLLAIPPASCFRAVVEQPMDNHRRPINEDELQVFFKLIGAGIWYLQHVENALNVCITVKGEIKEIGSVNAETGEGFLAKHQRNTFGTSLRIAKEMNILSVELMEQLESFKKERDWLVHKSMNQNADDLYLNSDRNLLLNRLNNFSENAQKLQNLIGKELEDFVVSKGVSREWIHKRAISDVSKKRGVNIS